MVCMMPGGNLHSWFSYMDRRNPCWIWQHLSETTVCRCAVFSVRNRRATGSCLWPRPWCMNRGSPSSSHGLWHRVLTRAKQMKKTVLKGWAAEKALSLPEATVSEDLGPHHTAHKPSYRLWRRNFRSWNTTVQEVKTGPMVWILRSKNRTQ